MTGCASPGMAQVSTNDTKFLSRAEPVLGLTADELRDALGSPDRVAPEDCVVPYIPGPNEKPVPIVGTTWLYIFEGPTMQAVMAICVVNGYAVAERRNMGGVDGTRLFNSSQELIDRALIEKAFKGELDGVSHEDRTGPQYSGPEYEI